MRLSILNFLCSLLLKLDYPLQSVQCCLDFATNYLRSLDAVTNEYVPRLFLAMTIAVWWVLVPSVNSSYQVVWRTCWFFFFYWKLCSVLIVNFFTHSCSTIMDFSASLSLFFWFCVGSHGKADGHPRKFGSIIRNCLKQELCPFSLFTLCPVKLKSCCFLWIRAEWQNPIAHWIKWRDKLPG